VAAAVGRCPREQYAQVNCQGTQWLLDRCRAAGVKRLLFVSTIAVRFDRLDVYPYAQSKRDAEHLVRSSGIPCLIVRPTIVTGADGPGWQSLRQLATLPITPVFGGGTNRVQPIDVDDLVECLVRLVETPWAEAVIELGGRDAVTMIELLRRIHQRHRSRPFRALPVPLAPLRALLGCLEYVVGHRLPMTRGQLAVFGNDGKIQPTEFYRQQQDSMLSLDELIDRASSGGREEADGGPKQQDGSDRATMGERECRVLSRYLLGRDPPPAVGRGYVKAHQTNIVDEAAASDWDRRLVRLAQRHPWLCQVVDSYCRFLAPQALLRRKLVLLLALWECEPSSEWDFRLERPTSAVWTSLRIAARLAACALLAIVGLVWLTPLKWLTALTCKTPGDGLSAESA
jgi:hypothetical protein